MSARADIDLRNPESGTVELDRALLEIVTILGRDFQRYSINHRIYFSPVDDVRRRAGSILTSVVADLSRMRRIALSFSIESLTWYLTIALYFHRFIILEEYWTVDMERAPGPSKSPNSIQIAR